MTSKIEGRRERFQKWVLATKHPVLGFLDGHWLARGDDREGYANEYVQGLWVAFKEFAEPGAPRQAEPVGLTVWEGAMPESNGKSNFTVILHAGDLAEGICVYRSEYPDRARYEADCFRHLIGDPAFPEKPFVCDYDADKHSGYVKSAPLSPDHSGGAGEVVLPERKEALNVTGSAYDDGICEGWNACLDKVKELNQ